MRKLIIGMAAVALCGIAVAGLDTYTGIQFIDLLKPTKIGRALDGITATNSTETLVITNSTVDGVRIANSQGQGAVVFSFAGSGSGTATFVLTQCATTNGTYTTVTNDSKSTYTVTNGTTQVWPIVPNNWATYMRTKVTVATTTVTNGAASAVLIVN